MGRGPWRQRKPLARPDNVVLDASPAAPKTGCSVAPRETAMDMHTPVIAVAPERVAELDRLGDQIAELSAHLEAAGARLLDLIRDFDARGGWNIGFRTCADWLSWRVGLTPGAARERVRVARALGTLPLLAQALARGELSYAKVRALTRVATPEDEARLLGVGRGGTAAQVERIVRGWRRVDRQAEAKESARRHASRALHVYEDEDGTVVLRGRLAPEVGALLRQALAAARETLYQQTRREATATSPADASADTPTRAQQQADALALLAETALHKGLDPGGPGERYQVVVHVDAAVLADPDQPGQCVREGGYQVELEPDGTLRFRRPDGRLLPDVPPPVAVPADPVQALRARHDTQGLRLHARTACPLWLGERLDLGWAIDVLHPLATRSAGSRP